MTTQKPFTPNTTKKLEKMATAANKISEAMKALEEAKKYSDDWAEWETLQYFKHQLQEFMSQDNGEAGFEPYVAKVEREEKRMHAFNRQGRRVRVVVP
ncbi:MAG: hypothetical protein CVU44_20975 [Chloroflexi bacterium HGW-Chloroflexi-6]|nr:MAG: hypothetical protein CVU44_20975 [Chloroflexi bacterium HGW-Chloroflexi-6]